MRRFVSARAAALCSISAGVVTGATDTAARPAGARVAKSSGVELIANIKAHRRVVWTTAITRELTGDVFKNA